MGSAGARHTRDFEDMVLWLAQRTDRTSVATLMRCSWEAVTAIINRGVTELLDARRLQTLYRIGVDEVCYRHPHRYLTIIGDHDTSTVVDIQPGRNYQSLANFYERQSDSNLAQIEAVSMDVESAYTEATRDHIAHAVICYDPFHIMRWVNRALDAVYSEAITGPGRASMTPAQWRTGRWVLRTGENKLSEDRRALINQIARTHRHIGRAWTLKNNSATSTVSITHPTWPASCCGAGSPRRNAAASTPSYTWPNDCRSTSRRSTRPSNAASPTPSSKASTPKSD